MGLCGFVLVGCLFSPQAIWAGTTSAEEQPSFDLDDVARLCVSRLRHVPPFFAAFPNHESDEERVLAILRSARLMDPEDLEPVIWMKTGVLGGIVEVAKDISSEDLLLGLVRRSTKLFRERTSKEHRATNTDLSTYIRLVRWAGAERALIDQADLIDLLNWEFFFKKKENDGVLDNEDAFFILDGIISRLMSGVFEKEPLEALPNFLESMSAMGESWRQLERGEVMDRTRSQQASVRSARWINLAAKADRLLGIGISYFSRVGDRDRKNQLMKKRRDFKQHIRQAAETLLADAVWADDENRRVFGVFLKDFGVDVPALDD